MAARCLHAGLWPEWLTFQPFIVGFTDTWYTDSLIGVLKDKSLFSLPSLLYLCLRCKIKQRRTKRAKSWGAFETIFVIREEPIDPPKFSHFATSPICLSSVLARVPFSSENKKWFDWSITWSHNNPSYPTWILQEFFSSADRSFVVSSYPDLRFFCLKQSISNS